jgi:hypothetical protein
MVRFNDVAIIQLASRIALVPIDPRYIEVCEANGFEAWASSRTPVPIGVCIEGGYVRLEVPLLPCTPLRVAIRLSGIRKGFANLRFPDRTAEEFEANERFIQSAYPGEKT